MTKTFPSPIGELHFSIIVMILMNSTKILLEFPSPIGELHFSIGYLRQWKNRSQ